jgi:hypothetical protein
MAVTHDLEVASGEPLFGNPPEQPGPFGLGSGQRAGNFQAWREQTATDAQKKGFGGKQ